MILVDANVLLYAVNTDAHHHERARAFLDESLSGGRTTAFAWIALLAFVRLVTKDGLFPDPLGIDDAMDRVDAWTGAPGAVILSPGPGHAGRVRALLRGVGSAGNLVNDSHLAALSIEHRCAVASFDNDFDRFEGVRRIEP